MQRVGVLHYSAPPVIGGVESVIQVHARLFAEMGYPVSIIAGRGSSSAFPKGVDFIQLPQIDSNDAVIKELSRELEQGQVPDDFRLLTEQMELALEPAVRDLDALIVHNVFTKHFNLPLTAALFRLLDKHVLRNVIAWCHDITWTSPRSRAKVFPGYPWDLLRTRRPDVTYVTISKDRQADLAKLFGCGPEAIRVIYNGVDPTELLALSPMGLSLINRLNLWERDLNLLMPVRVTQAKNIELALRVLAQIKESGLRAKLVVTGPPDPHDSQNMEYFEQLLALREQLNLTDAMHFIYELGKEPTEPLILDMPVVAELLRVSDALFMPSHREGFGMPILEAGLVGIPVFSSTAVPSAQEIAAQNISLFAPDAEPSEIAQLILQRMEADSVYRLKRHTRQKLGWQAIFQNEILPLIHGETV